MKPNELVWMNASTFAKCCVTKTRTNAVEIGVVIVNLVLFRKRKKKKL